MRYMSEVVLLFKMEGGEGGLNERAAERQNYRKLAVLSTFHQKISRKPSRSSEEEEEEERLRSDEQTNLFFTSSSLSLSFSRGDIQYHLFLMILSC